jgi:hypothetical protein
MVKSILQILGFLCVGACGVCAILMWLADARTQQHIKPGSKNRVSKLVPLRWFNSEVYTDEGNYWRRRAIRLYLWMFVFFLLSAVFLVPGFA